MRIAFIPAKGTSLGLRNKNLLPIGQKSLLERALRLAIKSKSFEKIVVSTESGHVVTEVLRILGECGMSSEEFNPGESICKLTERVEIHIRSSNNSGNLINTVDVVLEYLELSRITSGLLMLLQPTSPFRHDEEISKIFELHGNYPRYSVLSAKVTESPHPEKSFRLQLSSSGEYILEKKPPGISVPRQNLQKWGCPDGAYYLTPIDLILDLKTLITEPSLLFIREGFFTLNIDSEIDYEFAKYLIDQGRMI